MAHHGAVRRHHHDGHHVEAHHHVREAVLLQIQAGDALVAIALLRGHGLGREPHGGARARLHLHEHQRVPVEGDDVRLAGYAGPVALQDVVAAVEQEPRRSLLAPAAELLVAGLAGPPSAASLRLCGRCRRLAGAGALPARGCPAPRRRPCCCRRSLHRRRRHGWPPSSRRSMASTIGAPSSRSLARPQQMGRPRHLPCDLLAPVPGTPLWRRRPAAGAPFPGRTAPCTRQGPSSAPCRVRQGPSRDAP